MRYINYKCKYFRADMPCTYHKKNITVICENCAYAELTTLRICIVKLDAMGDVMRTTSILPELRKKYPSGYIAWITDENSVPILKNNPYIDEIIPTSQFMLATADRWDIVISLDSTKRSTKIATILKGSKVIGYYYSKEGFAHCSNKYAEKWFEMGIFDDIKMLNTEEHQKIMADTCELPLTEQSKPVLFLTQEEKNITHTFIEQYKLEGKKVIGINTGTGDRWLTKQWKKEYFIELIKLLISQTNYIIVLYGGPGEVEKNQYIYDTISNDARVILTKCDNPIRYFAALVNASTIFVTGDTLALHIATALSKTLIVLLGPTSNTEVPIYNNGEKIFADMDCLCCYKNTCDKSPTCMDNITPKIVLDAIKRQVNKIETAK